jgi:LytS/YehU family sensor histidine kinase
MSLNTLIENAVKHGIAKTKNGGLIQIDINTLGHDVIIKVRNTGQYNPQPKTSANGIGLDNLRKRLELHYGSKASFSITNEDDNVLATIIMPF